MELSKHPEDATSDNGMGSFENSEKGLETKLNADAGEDESENDDAYNNQNWFKPAEKRWPGGSEKYTGIEIQEEDEDNSDEGSPATSPGRESVYDTEENDSQCGSIGATKAELHGGLLRNKFRGLRIQKDESEVLFHTTEFDEADLTSFLDSNAIMFLLTMAGYLIRTDRSWSCACTLAISHNASSKTTYGVCIGLKPYEAESLVGFLQREKRYAGNPLFVAVALVEIYIQVTMAMNRRHNKDFYNIQTAMKTDYYIISPKVQRTLDLVEFASRLTALGSSSVGVTQLCSTQHRIMQFLDDQLKTLKKEAPETDTVLTALGERLAFTRELLQAERQHNEYIKGAAQTQVQMVYSLTAQRDNEHNLNLARLSQKQNRINIQISKFAAYESRISNKMAKESLRYGVDMQIIAAVTLGFLPGTFMATLFSASFWDFQPDNQGRIVSSWVWLYWVLTVVLTVGVLAAWRIMSRVKADGLEPPPEAFVLENLDDSGDIA
ncbi:uncharacterized protein TRUGW13939_05004 [Talaromyces rugulosus]|uniref:Uncharacterized protein n=1 Tax=Talaromyces rugulosus TaxID=121627 RepID=A0A7H8QV34_TALRU|nr:uncharacterized protein TRUGW13939_05004 [Talaromyces rugulosus]QKX57884.1 hypothetical protein TRUGW13939_05004 [Talaromyces rugulosus]